MDNNSITLQCLMLQLYQNLNIYNVICEESKHCYKK